MKPAWCCRLIYLGAAMVAASASADAAQVTRYVCGDAAVRTMLLTVDFNTQEVLGEGGENPALISDADIQWQDGAGAYHLNRRSLTLTGWVTNAAPHGPARTPDGAKLGPIACKVVKGN
jgi:hypothetical protein